MTNGNVGHLEKKGDELAQIRKEEAIKSAEILGV